MEPKCNKYSDIELFRYLQGRSLSEEEEDIQLHMMSCQYCFDKISKMRQLSNKLLEKDTMSEDVKIEHPKKIKLFGSKLLAISSAAAILVIAVVGYNTFISQNPSIPIENDPGSIHHNIDSARQEVDSTKITDEFEGIEVHEEE